MTLGGAGALVRRRSTPAHKKARRYHIVTARPRIRCMPCGDIAAQRLSSDEGWREIYVLQHREVEDNDRVVSFPGY